jgi:hypothetical protein
MSRICALLNLLLRYCPVLCEILFFCRDQRETRVDRFVYLGGVHDSENLEVERVSSRSQDALNKRTDVVEPTKPVSPFLRTVNGHVWVKLNIVGNT